MASKPLNSCSQPGKLVSQHGWRYGSVLPSCIRAPKPCPDKTLPVPEQAGSGSLCWAQNSVTTNASTNDQHSISSRVAVTHSLLIPSPGMVGQGTYYHGRRCRGYVWHDLFGIYSSSSSCMGSTIKLAPFPTVPPIVPPFFNS